MSYMVADIEEWKTIKDFPMYAISNKGCVKRIISCAGQRVGKILSQRPNPSPKYSKCHYPSVRLSRRRKLFIRKIHILVLEAFISPRPFGLVANHKDGKKENNHINNLEWCTQSENVKHSFAMGLKKNKKGYNHCRAKLKEGEVWLVRRLLESKKFTQQYIAQMFKVHYSTISLIKLNKHYKNQGEIS